ncbi:zinc-binding dehydrogenase [Actinoplanes sp. NPDC051470]|uniref:zinc-binding dehydrogenase n=1 Tax=Actinoplanes sp. NPDC051470 TaxID=3157224 RepID=UPI0034231D7D
MIDYHATRFEDVAEDVDVVLDLVGGETGVRSLRTLRPGGLVIAVPSGVSAELATAAQQAGKRATGILVEPDGAALTTIAALIDAGAVAAEVDEVFPLADTAEAHRRGETGRTRGKLVLRVAED